MPSKPQELKEYARKCLMEIDAYYEEKYLPLCELIISYNTELRSNIEGALDIVGNALFVVKHESSDGLIATGMYNEAEYELLELQHEIEEYFDLIHFDRLDEMLNIAKGLYDDISDFADL